MKLMRDGSSRHNVVNLIELRCVLSTAYSPRVLRLCPHRMTLDRKTVLTSIAVSLKIMLDLSEDNFKF